MSWVGVRLGLRVGFRLGSCWVHDHVGWVFNGEHAGFNDDSLTIAAIQVALMETHPESRIGSTTVTSFIGLPNHRRVFMIDLVLASIGTHD